MLEACDKILDFARGRHERDLNDDSMLLFAVVRAVEIVGEAATKVSPEVRADAPQIPWKALRGMRNRLIHAYFDIDTEILWKTVSDDIPVLASHLRALLTG